GRVVVHKIGRVDLQAPVCLLCRAQLAVDVLDDPAPVVHRPGTHVQLTASQDAAGEIDHAAGRSNAVAAHDVHVAGTEQFAVQVGQAAHAQPQEVGCADEALAVRHGGIGRAQVAAIGERAGL